MTLLIMNKKWAQSDFVRLTRLFLRLPLFESLCRYTTYEDLKSLKNCTNWDSKHARILDQFIDQKRYIPLPFWFKKPVGFSIALISVPYNNIIITLKPRSDLVILNPIG